MKLLAINGTIVGSKTLSLIKDVIKKIHEQFSEVDTTILDLKAYNLEFCDGRKVEQYSTDTQEAIKLVKDADFYLIATPIFQGSIPGTLKNFIDLIPPDYFHNKVMGFVATGGTDQHFLVVENQLKPIAGYLKCVVVPDYVYANKNHFNEYNELTDPDVLKRVSELAAQMGRMQKALAHVRYWDSNRLEVGEK